LDVVTETELCNTTPIAIPDSGPASLYPSSITVSGFPPQLAKVAVTLKGVHHGRPDDLDILLSAPRFPGNSGVRVTLLSDAGGVSPLVGADLRFDADAPGPFPDE